MARKQASPTRAARKGHFAERICNLVPSRGTDQDWEMQNALASGAHSAPAALPPALDLRQPWWKIGNQLGTGACVGWATADGVMRYLLVKANRLGPGQRLSPRFIWMASKETDEYVTRPETFIEEAGTSLKAALDIARKYGTVPDSLLPFKIDTLMYVGDENSFFATASTRRAANYFNLRKNLGQWKSWLAGTGPILAGLSVDQSWDEVATDGKLDTFQPATVRGGHAVCIVGYTKDRFIVRNSWGPTWGDKGFGYASAAYITAAFFDESYGVTL